jgi:hypothetical protein
LLTIRGGKPIGKHPAPYVTEEGPVRRDQVPLPVVLARVVGIIPAPPVPKQSDEAA